MSLNYNLLVSEVDFRRKKDAKKMKKKWEKVWRERKKVYLCNPVREEGVQKERQRGRDEVREGPDETRKVH